MPLCPWFSNRKFRHGRILEDVGIVDLPNFEPDALKRDHVFVKFAESQVMKEVIQLFSDLKSELGLGNQLSTFSTHFHALKRELGGKVPDRWEKFYSVLGFDKHVKLTVYVLQMK